MKKKTLVLLVAGLLFALALSACATIGQGQVNTPVIGPGFTFLSSSEVELMLPIFVETSDQVKQLENHRRSAQFTWAETILESQTRVQTQHQISGLCRGGY